jgi:hypothetical protein
VREVFDADGGLVTDPSVQAMSAIIDQELLLSVFAGNAALLAEYREASVDFRRVALQRVKMSEFAERVFEAFARQQQQPVLLRKGEYYRMLDWVPAQQIPAEVTEKLDRIVSQLKEPTERPTP